MRCMAALGLGFEGLVKKFYDVRGGEAAAAFRR